MKRSGVWSLGRSTSRVGGCVGREVYCWGRGGGAGVGRGGTAEGRRRLTSGSGGVLGGGGVLWLALYGEREAAAERGRWGMWP